MRALIDPGSQATLITEQAVQSLRLPKKKIYAEISGLGATDAGIARSKVEVTIEPRFKSDFKLLVSALVLPNLTKLMPDKNNINKIPNQLKNVELADPTFFVPGPIDMILGADVYGDIILNGIKKGSKCSPVVHH